MARFIRDFGSTLVHLVRHDKPTILLHLGTATGLAGFMMTDPLPLRCCSITASVSSITYVMTRTPVQSLAPVYWSSCFIAVNCIKIAQLLMERKSISLSTVEEDVYTRHFMKYGLRPRQFKRLIDHATAKQYAPGTVIDAEGPASSPRTVKLLTQGTVSVLKNNEELFVVDAKKPICFLGDLHLLEVADSAQGRDDSVIIPSFSSTAVAGTKDPVEVLEWDNSYLLDVLKEKSETSSKLRAVLTSSVMQKLIDIGQMNTRSKYITLLGACAADGAINALEKKVLKEYAQSHGISQQDHVECLATIGWTEEEYHKGILKSGSNETKFSMPMWNALKRKLRSLNTTQLEELNEMKDSGVIKLKADASGTKNSGEESI